MLWDYCEEIKCKDFNGVRCKFPDSEYVKIDPSECRARNNKRKSNIIVKGSPNDNKQFKFEPYPKGD